MKKSHIILITNLILLLIIGCKSSKFQTQIDVSEIFPISINGKWYLNDTLGNQISPLQFDEIELYKFGLAVAKKDGKYGYVNLKGKWEIKPKFDAAKDFYYNCAEVIVENEKFHINRKGKRTKYLNCSESNLIPSCYPGSKMETIFNTKEYVIKNGNKFAVRYEQVNDTSDYVYDSVKAFDRDFFIVERNEKFGFFFRPIPRVYKGNSYIGDTIERYQYDEIVVTPPNINKYTGLFHNLSQIHKYRIGPKWGVIDWHQIRITEPKYHSIKIKTDEKYILVEFDENKFGYIDETGKELFVRK